MPFRPLHSHSTHPSNASKRETENGDPEQMGGPRVAEAGPCLTYIGLEVTGCRMTWGARVGVSGTGTTSEGQRSDSQRTNMQLKATPESLILRRFSMYV